MSYDFSSPIEDLVDEAIQSCPVEYRIKLFNNIVLSGGSTMFNHFDKRLQKNIQKKVNKRMAAYNAITGNNDSIEVGVS